MLNLKRNKRAFTIIELLVVIAILGILVLLATPKFLGYVEKANLARIKSDVKVAESVVGVELIYSGNLSKWGSSVDVDLEKSKSENKLYDTRGYVTGPIENGPYWKIDQSEFKSKLEGNFYANQGGKVYYEDIKSSNDAGTPEEPALPEDNTPVATDADFTWVPDSAGYSFSNETGKGYYKYTGSAKEVKIPHTIKDNQITSYYRMFYETDVTKVVSDNPNITSMNYMFRSSQATSLDLSSFNTSNVTNMAGMFYGSLATELDLSSFDTSNVTNMYGMFFQSQATELDLSLFDTSNVTNMYGMFHTSQATELDLSSFNTSNVTNMQAMFEGSRATSLDLRSFNTSNVTNMYGMFHTSQAAELDLSSFNTSNVTDMKGMFYGSQATSLDLSSFNTSKVTNMESMFEGSRATELDLSSFDTSNVTNMLQMFRGSQATSLDLRSFNTSNVTNMRLMFADSWVKELDLSSFDTSKVTDMGYMFYGSQATLLNLSSFYTSNVTNMEWMFSGSQATTGYARTEADANRLNSSRGKPTKLTFRVK